MIEYLFSCEYATCTVPQAYRELFPESEEVVTSAAGWEPGALNLAQACAMKFRTPLLHTEITKLLVDVEKVGAERWSSYAAKLSDVSQARLSERHFEPYRAQLESRIAEGIKRHERVLHILVHTDDDLNGQVVLETPAGGRLSEACADSWCSKMKREDLRVKHLKNVDGTPLCRKLAKEFPASQYAQIKLRVSQSFFLEGQPWRWSILKKHLLDSLMLATQDLKISNDLEFSSIPQG